MTRDYVLKRYPYRNCRFELLSFSTRPLASYAFLQDGKLHGLISASDKHGLLSDGGSHFFEPDFAHVPLFNYDFHEPIKMINGYLVYLCHSISGHSIPFTSFSSFIELYMELYVTKKKECHQDYHAREVIMNDSCKFKPQLGDCSSGTISGTEGCSLEEKVKWNYQGRYL
uniref:Arginine--tRNA ligase, chloroplastic/mitochondrial n=1 Tax=Tanacetum cinerariifolium TaxID=118510 RepID=A0A699IJV6_TANCI|nr:arginine--tRNA ligase, chloroplastic/mitochondrial [Tanacetum cinerariifolium]